MKLWIDPEIVSLILLICFWEQIKHSVLFFLSLLDQDVVCDKNNAPSVSSISRVLRGGHTDGCTSDEGRTNHSIDGILGKT